MIDSYSCIVLSNGTIARLVSIKAALGKSNECVGVSLLKLNTVIKTCSGCRGHSGFKFFLYFIYVYKLKFMQKSCLEVMFYNVCCHLQGAAMQLPGGQRQAAYE